MTDPRRKSIRKRVRVITDEDKYRRGRRRRLRRKLMRVMIWVTAIGGLAGFVWIVIERFTVFRPAE